LVLLISIYAGIVLVKNSLINLEISCVDPDQRYRRATNTDPDQNAQSCSLFSIYAVNCFVQNYLINLEMSCVDPDHNYGGATNVESRMHSHAV
jgi:hypothetical protein